MHKFQKIQHICGLGVQVDLRLSRVIFNFFTFIVLVTLRIVFTSILLMGEINELGWSRKVLLGLVLAMVMLH